MRDFLVQAAKVDDSSEAADRALDDFQKGTASSMEATLALSLALVTCARAVQMLERRMREIEQDARLLKEAA